MTHDEAVAAALRAHDSHAEAVEHITDCGECTEVLRLLGVLLTPQSAPDDTEQRSSSRCEVVQDAVLALPGLSAVEMASRHPSAVAHLRWCIACRELLADVLEYSKALEQGDVPSLFASAYWTHVADRAGRRARELVGRLVVRVSEGMAAFVDVPAGLSTTSAELVTVLRGEPTAGTVDGVELPLGDGRHLTLRLLSPDGQAAMLELDSPSIPIGTTIKVRQRAGADLHLIGMRTLETNAPIRFGPLPAGRYVVEIVQAGAADHRLEIEVM